MNKKRWIVIAIALVLLVASSLANRPASRTDTTSDWTDQQVRAILNADNRVREVIIEEGIKDDRIMIIPVEGIIGETNATYNHELILAAIDQIAEDETIKAVLLTIDSPGGAVYHTQEAYGRFQEALTQRDIPIYASMGSMAASGGYYYAMVADQIYAAGETITGSIGVISSYYQIDDLMDQLGVENVVYKSGELKDMMSSSRQPTSEEEQVMQDITQEMFDTFVDVVVSNRPMDESQIRQLADGRIYTGQQAVENGLIDEIGYEKDALQTLKEDFDLEDAQVFQLASTSSSFTSLLPFLSESDSSDYADQVSKIIHQLEGLQDIKFEYRWEGGY